MSNRRSVIRGTNGLNTVVDPVRLEYDWRTGISDLAVAVNIYVDEANRPNRRDGRNLKLSCDGHSIFCDGGDCIFVDDSSLYLLGSDLTTKTLLRSLNTDARMSCVQVGARIYYTNSLDFGYIEDGVSNTWAKTTDYVGPTSRKHLEGPFAGNHLAFRDGRMYISKVNVLWYSEYLAVDWYRKARNFLYFNSHIRMVKPVTGGLYVSTENRIYFLHGETVAKFRKDPVTPYPALEWSDCIEYVDGKHFPDLGFSGLCALWATTEGAMIGSPDGRVANLNRDKVIYPKGTKGASLLKGLHFIHTLE